ncbi:MAG: hypothetical protein QM817_28270 [Archangium sp.]
MKDTSFRRFAPFVTLVILGSSCLDPVREEISQATQAAKDTTVCTGCPDAWSSKQGFVVHEWGTLTLVLGSDGTVLPGLHHEAEDLPLFVTDRLANAASLQSYGVAPALSKMETPVTYFYSPVPRTVSARVRFPHGLLTQWYPEVKKFTPEVFGSVANPRDSWSLRYCSIGAYPEQSELDWGTFDVLGREAKLEAPSNPGLTWDFARGADSNVLSVPVAGKLAQREKFLFYRGLSEAPPAFRPTFEGERVVLQNDEALPRGGLLLMNVTKNGAGVTVVGDLASGERKVLDVPAPELEHSAFVERLRSLLTARLVAAGLYADEANSMVNTWERSYFLTPGVRLLYLLPQRELETMLPLDITPKPDATVRAMVIRLELQPPSREAELLNWSYELANPATADAARAKFLALGRFAEPLLTRTIELTPTDADARKLAEWNLMSTVQNERRWAPVTAE